MSNLIRTILLRCFWQVIGPTLQMYTYHAPGTYFTFYSDGSWCLRNHRGAIAAGTTRESFAHWYKGRLY